MDPTSFPIRRLLLFATLSATDFFLTWNLIREGNGPVYESNPTARWCLEQYGWGGLAAYKAVMVLFFVAVALVIHAARPRTGRRVLTAACCIVGTVVVYSCSLMGYVQAEEANGPALGNPISRVTGSEGRWQEEYRLVLQRAIRDLTDQRCTLDEAVDRLAQTERGRDPGWLSLLRTTHPGHSDREVLTRHLLACATAYQQQVTALRQVSG